MTIGWFGVFAIMVKTPFYLWRWRRIEGVLLTAVLITVLQAFV